MLQEIVMSGVLLLSHGLLNSLSGVAMGWAAMIFTIWMIGGTSLLDTWELASSLGYLASPPPQMEVTCSPHDPGLQGGGLDLL